MKNLHQGSEDPPTIEDLYPELAPEERAEAEDTLNRYATLLVRIVERRSAEREWTAMQRDGTKAPKGSE
jgi:hypothetical protein